MVCPSSLFAMPEAHHCLCARETYQICPEGFYSAIRDYGTANCMKIPARRAPSGNDPGPRLPSGDVRERQGHTKPDAVISHHSVNEERGGSSFQSPGNSCRLCSPLCRYPENGSKRPGRPPHREPSPVISRSSSAMDSTSYPKAQADPSYLRLLRRQFLKELLLASSGTCCSGSLSGKTV